MMQKYNIELSLEGRKNPDTGIRLNAGNRSSVSFRFKVYQNNEEVDYSQFQRAQVVFKKAGGFLVEDGCTITAQGITYTLIDQILSKEGTVTGQLNLISDAMIITPLHFYFTVYEDFLQIDETVEKQYLNTFEKMRGELQEVIDEIKIMLDEESNDILEEMLLIAEKMKKRLAEEEQGACDFIERLLADLVENTEEANEKIAYIRQQLAQDIQSLKNGMELVIEQTDKRITQAALAQVETLESILNEAALILADLQEMSFASLADFDGHVQNTETHVSAEEKACWHAKAFNQDFVLTLAGEDWVLKGPEEQTACQIIPVSGMTGDTVPIVDVCLSKDPVAALQEMECWSFVDKVESVQDALVFYCYQEIPYMDIKVQVKVVDLWRRES